MKTLTTSLTAVSLMIAAATAHAQTMNIGYVPEGATAQTNIYLPPGQTQWIKVKLQYRGNYKLTVQSDSVYPQIYPPPRNDLEVGVKRYWNHQLRFKKSASGLGSATLHFQAYDHKIDPHQDHGNRWYKICIKNNTGSSRLMVTLGPRRG